MKYAIVSDIHANLVAWQAVWKDRVRREVDEVICLGDVVGYGPQPAEVLAAVRANASCTLMGNHDAAVAGIFGTELFNEEARQMVEWTVDKLGDHALRYLRELPYVAEIESNHGMVTCTHASLEDPHRFVYVFTEQHARHCWAARENTITFVGHTHMPRVDILDPRGGYGVRLPRDFVPRENHRYIVNVGSVGMPRVGDAEASYCTFDTHSGFVQWQRVPYDVDAYRRQVVAMLGETGHAQSLLDTFEEKQPMSPQEREEGKPTMLPPQSKPMRLQSSTA